MKTLKLPLLLVLTFTTVFAQEYSYRTKEDLSNKVKGQDSYAFDSCSKYDSDSSFYSITCQQEESEPAHNGLRKDIQAITSSQVRNYLNKKVQEETLLKLQNNIKAIDYIINCFENAHKQECQNTISTNSQATEVLHDNMVTALALSKNADAQKLSSNGTIDKSNYLNTKLKHPYTGESAGELNKEQEKQLLDILKQQEKNKRLSYRQKKVDDQNPCFVETKNGPRYKNQICRMNHLATENDQVKVDFSLNAEAYRSEYNSIISSAPHLLYYNPSKSKNKADALKKAYEILKEKLTEKYNDTKNMGRSSLYKLIANKDITNSVISNNPGLEKVFCDLAQQQFIRNKREALAADLLVAGSSIIGLSLCGLSGGMMCPIGVTLATEAASITLAQSRLDKALSDFNAGLINADVLEKTYKDKYTSLLLAPTNFTAFKLARSLKNTSKVALKGVRNKKELVNKFLDYTPTTPAENARWIKNAQKDKGYFVDIENGALKRLNDSLDDKDTVTALTNMHKYILTKNIKTLQDKYPSLDIQMYSDFKSTRLSVNLPGANRAQMTKLNEDISKVYKDTNEEFAKKVSDLKDVKIDPKDNVANWFNCGANKTADMAGLLSRKARNLRSRNVRCNLFDGASKYELVKSLRNVEESRLKVVSHLNQSAPELLTDRLTLARPLIEVLRKNKETSNADLAKLINNRFGVNLTPDMIDDIKDYSTKADSFSPGIWIEKRELASLESATNGALSADFKGMGAFNEESVQRALLNSKGDLEKAVKLLREEEQRVTKEFNRKKDQFKRSVLNTLQKNNIKSDTVCSGDDCVAIVNQSLNPSVKKDLVNDLIENESPSTYRLVFVPNKAKAQDRTMLGVHGELVEKTVRKTLTGSKGEQMNDSIMDNIVFAFDMPQTLKNGEINVILGNKGQDLSKEQVQRVKEHVKKAIQSVNKEFNANYSTPSSFQILQ